MEEKGQLVVQYAIRCGVGEWKHISLFTGNKGGQIVIFIAGILQIAFLVLAIKASVDGDTARTILLCALMICEEISAQHMMDRKEAK